MAVLFCQVLQPRARTEHGAREPRPQRGPVNSEVVLALVVAWSALRTRTAAVFAVCPARVSCAGVLCVWVKRSDLTPQLPSPAIVRWVRLVA